MNWHDVWLSIYAKRQDSDIADEITCHLMQDCAAWDWDVEAPSHIQTRVSCIPPKPTERMEA